MAKDGVLPPFFQVLMQKSEVLCLFVSFLRVLGHIKPFLLSVNKKFRKCSKKLFKQPKYDRQVLKLKITEAKRHLLAISKSSKKVSKIVS